MTTSTTLPTGPFEHIALDYTRLRAEGIRLLGRLAGVQWTDFNEHDPGITILEQLCYAITDFAYRVDHPMADLLAGSDAALALPGPAEVMTCDPVTEADLRRLVLDVHGVHGASVEPRREPDVAVAYHPGSHELRFDVGASDLDARPVRLSGLQRVLLQSHDTEQALGAVAARLHARRGLCEDFSLTSFKPSRVWIRARIEVGPVDDPRGLLDAVQAQIKAYLEPPVRFTTPVGARAEGRGSDDLFDGPALEHGHVSGELPQVRRSVRVSDLIHAIMDVPSVRAVPLLEVASSRNGPWERWLLTIPAGHAPALAPDSELQLLRAGLPLPVPAAKAPEGEEKSAVRPWEPQLDVSAPSGRQRRLGSYRSVQHDFPAVYGVGPLGLASSAPPERRARAKQLKAYLLLFEQVLADACAQLAHVGELLSPSDEPRTYFGQPIVDPALGLEELQVDAAFSATRPDPAGIERRGRFLGHLLARFAEQLGGQAAGGTAMIAARRDFLRDIARLGRARGSGHDVLDEDGVSAYEQRLRLKLGLREGPRFHVVEHILLRPVPEDRRQIDADGGAPVPLLAAVDEPDPWSLRVSLVFESRADDEADSFEQLVARTIIDETPAHLQPYLHWVESGSGESPWNVFEAAWLSFKRAYRDYRRAALRSDYEPVAESLHLRVRGARDRVIDLLGFGLTYPLRDVPVSAHVFVPPGKPARITVELSQPDVVYELYDRETGAPLVVDGRPIEAAGNGGTLELLTPPVIVDFTCRIRAVKLGGRGTGRARAVWLRGTVRVEEGVDPSLVTRIRRPLLDSDIADPRPDDVRIADHGDEVEVEVVASQEGVEYTLVDDSAPSKVLSKTVVGTSGTITLRTVALAEDVDLRVRCVKHVGDPKQPQTDERLLDIVLPLRVRPNPAVAAELAAGIVEHGTGATVRLTGTQETASYRVWRRRLRDAEFVFQNPPPTPTIDVDDDGRTIRVARPPHTPVWQALPGFEPQGEAHAGTGDVLEIPLSEAVEASLLLVEASKRHPIGVLARELDARLRGGGLVEGLEIDLFAVDDGGEHPSVRRLEGGGVRVPEDPPRLACRPEELARLRTDAGASAARQSLLARARAACMHKERVTAADLPPLGGQHEMRYRCPDCDVKLREPARPKSYPFMPPEESLIHACPKCGREFTGYPFDAYIYGLRHIAVLDTMYQCAFAYKAISLEQAQIDLRAAEQEKERFAGFASSILLAYAERMREYPLITVWCRCAPPRKGVAHLPQCGDLTVGGQLHAQTLDEARLIVRVIAPAYDLLRGYLTAEQRKRLESELFAPILERLLAYPDREARRISNWHTWHAAALVSAGIALGDSGKAEAGRAALEYQLDPANHALSAEGFWHESSWGYQLFTLDAFVRTAEAGRCSGTFDLWADARLRAMALVPFVFRMPDGTLPSIGDTRSAPLSDAVRPFVEQLFYAIPSRSIEPLLPASGLYTALRGARPAASDAQQKRDFPVDGYSVLATDGPAGLRAVVAYGPFSAAHGHCDKLGFVLFGFGRELGVDPGREANQAYNAPIHRGWYRATLSHNTIVVDGGLQAPVRGSRLAYGASDDGLYAAVSLRAADIYPGVDHARVLVLGPDYLAIIDDLLVKDGRSRTIDWLYHNRGLQAVLEGLTVASGDPPQWSLEPPPAVRTFAEMTEGERAAEVHCYANDGGRFIVTDARQQPRLHVPGERAFRIRFEPDGAAPSTFVSVAGAPGTSVLLGDGPHGLEVGGAKVRVPLVRVRRTTSTRARFVAVIEAVQQGGAPRFGGVDLAIDTGDRLQARFAAETIDVAYPAGAVTVEVSGARKLSIG